VIPTAVPLAALSETVLAAALLSETGPIAASEVSSVRLTVKLRTFVLPSVEVYARIRGAAVAALEQDAKRLNQPFR